MGEGWGGGRGEGFGVFESKTCELVGAFYQDSHPMLECWQLNIFPGGPEGGGKEIS